jgi:hypothetical protein
MVALPTPGAVVSNRYQSCSSPTWTNANSTRPELRAQTVDERLDGVGLGVRERLEDVEDQADGVVGLPGLALLHLVDAHPQRTQKFFRVAVVVGSREVFDRM